MSIFSSPFKAYVRWRHSHGYGVHSPFAYNLVTSAVNPGGYGYYGYADIDDAISSPGFKGYRHSRKDARLLLRLLVSLQSRRLLLPKGFPAFEAAAAGAGIGYRLLKSNSLPSPCKGDFLVTVSGTTDAEYISKLLEHGGSVMAVSPDSETVSALYQGCKRGLILHGTRIVIAIPRQEMAFVSYPMKF